MKTKVLIAAATILAASLSMMASGPALMRVERKTGGDRVLLLEAGVPLVHEFPGGFLAAGDGPAVEARLRQLGYGTTLIETDTTGWVYYTAVFPGQGGQVGEGRCGEVVWAEPGWMLLRSAAELRGGCPGDGHGSIQRLSLKRLGIPSPPPEAYAALQEGAPQSIAPSQLVQQLLAGVAEEGTLAGWDAVIGAARSRHTSDDGCKTAAGEVLARFQGLGLDASLQAWSPSDAPNVIGTIVGKDHPEKVVIALAHLDDMPGYGPAPGADDNASGVAMLLAAAEAMAPYSFDGTVKFLAVTGEEQGLLGAWYYAIDAQERGEQIQAVLNADMIGWEGDTPGSENLDLNYIGSSRWLGELFAQCATVYGTGCEVDAFECRIGASDHAPFWDLGYSAVCGITDNEGYCGHSGSYKYYHTAADTREHCGSPSFFMGAVRAYIATLSHLAVPLCLTLDSPRSLSATPEGENQVRLTWEAVADGPAFEVYRSKAGCDASSFAMIGTTTAATFLDPAACGDIRYAYRVVARDPSGPCSSPPSPCAEAQASGQCLEAPAHSGLPSADRDEME